MRSGHINEITPGPSQWVLSSSRHSVCVRAGESRARIVAVLSCVVVSCQRMCLCRGIDRLHTGWGRRGRWRSDEQTVLDSAHVMLPVVSVTTVARCRCPSTRNWGSCTSLLIPTLVCPSFQWYRMSLIVYPTPETCQTHKTLSLTLR